MARLRQWAPALQLLLLALLVLVQRVAPAEEGDWPVVHLRTRSIQTRRGAGG